MDLSILGIIGAGGFGREVAQYAFEINKEHQYWREIAFIDDNIEKGTLINGVPVIGTLESLAILKEEILVVCAIGNTKIKYDVVQRALKQGFEFTNIIHPLAYIADIVKLGTGNIIAPLTVITTNVVLGDHIAINPQCGIGHDVVIEDYTSLYWNVNLSGNVKVGIGSELGTKTTIIQGINVGDWTIVGAGAVVISDLPSGCTAVGIPAKVIKR